MATYKGNDIVSPDQLDTDIKRTLAPRPGLENIEEDLKLPPSAEPDYVPRPGQKHYMENQQMADDNYNRERFNNPNYNSKEGFRGEGPRSSGKSLPPSVGDRNLNDPVTRQQGSRHLNVPPAKTPEAIGVPGFQHGGMVKHGSSTHVSCKNKH